MSGLVKTVKPHPINRTLLTEPDKRTRLFLKRITYGTYFDRIKCPSGAI